MIHTKKDNVSTDVSLLWPFKKKFPVTEQLKISSHKKHESMYSLYIHVYNIYTEMLIQVDLGLERHEL